MASKHERAQKFIVSCCERINSAAAAAAEEQEQEEEEDADADAQEAPLFGGEGVGFVEKGFGFVCRCIAEAAGAPAAGRLLGTTPEMQAEVSQWLSIATSFVVVVVVVDAAAAAVAKKKQQQQLLTIDGRLQLLNAHLEDRSVFAGRGLAISLADLSMFAVVHDIVSEDSYAELLQLPHLLRWLDYIQSKEAAAKIYPHIPVEKAKFDPPNNASSPSASPSPSAPVLASKRIALASASSASSTRDHKTVESIKKTSAL